MVIKKAIAVYIIFIMIFGFSGCVESKDTELNLLLESKIEELEDTIEDLEKINNELKKEDRECKNSLADTDRMIEGFNRDITEYTKHIETFKKEMNYDKVGIGIDSAALSNNVLNYSVFKNYDDFSLAVMENEESIEYIPPYYTYDAQYRSMVLYEFVRDKEYGLLIGLYMVYDDDTGNILELDLVYYNPYDNEDLKEVYEDSKRQVIGAYLMSLYGPTLYSDDIETLIDDFMENGTVLDGSVGLYVLDIYNVGHMVIK